MILVTGANGHLGSSTIDFLQKNNPDTKITGLVRSEEKGAELKEQGIEIRIGDYLDPESLDLAFEGVDTLLLISSSTIQNRVKQHKNVIDAALKADVDQLFYTSMLQADKELSSLATDHHQTEKAIKASGIDHTIFRHTFYTEFFPMFLGDALETGNWMYPSNEQKVNFALRIEMAEALANALVQPEEHVTEVYEITSDKAYTFGQYADILSTITGKDISYTDIPLNDFVEGLKQAGLDEETIGMAKVSAEGVVNGALNHTSDDLQKLLGRAPTGTDEFLKEFLES